MSTQVSTHRLPGAENPFAFGSVVVGEDASVGSRAALRWAAQHVAGDVHVVRAVSPGLELLESSFQLDSGGHARVRQVHAISPTLLALMPTPSAAEMFESRAEQHLSYLTAGHPEWETVVVFEHSLPALAEASTGASMVIVGSHRSSRMGGFLTGSIAQHLPTMADCAVAVLPIVDPVPPHDAETVG